MSFIIAVFGFLTSRVMRVKDRYRNRRPVRFGNMDTFHPSAEPKSTFRRHRTKRSHALLSTIQHGARSRGRSDLAKPLRIVDINDTMPRRSGPTSINESAEPSSTNQQMRAAYQQPADDSMHSRAISTANLGAYQQAADKPTLAVA